VAAGLIDGVKTLDKADVDNERPSSNVSASDSPRLSIGPSNDCSISCKHSSTIIRDGEQWKEISTDERLELALIRECSQIHIGMVDSLNASSLSRKNTGSQGAIISNLGTRFFPPNGIMCTQCPKIRGLVMPCYYTRN
jgi:hypothetical protein